MKVPIYIYKQSFRTVSSGPFCDGAVPFAGRVEKRTRVVGFWEAAMRGNKTGPVDTPL